MNPERIEKELRFLKIYAVALTAAFLVFATLVLSGSFSKVTSSQKFEEINVERINIIEKDGKLRLVISNQARQHPGIVDGKTFDERKGQRPPGLMFFSEKGDEIGGLVFDGSRDKGQGGSLTFDKFRGDQTIQIIHDENPDGKYFSGIKMNDQNTPMLELVEKEKDIEKLPTKEAKAAAYQTLRDQGVLMTERLKIGRDYDKSSVIKMKDAKGKVRIELKVEPDGNSKIDFLNEAGKVTFSLPKDVTRVRQ